MFSVCDKCFGELSPEEILEYCRQLINEWKKDAIENEKIDLDIIKYNIEYLKNGTKE